ncbi:MAG TPA: nuclear transport factor 2 family protein [Acidimicrobiales bacterium]|nr:nuclear transport factor 2 family protein [Acidimicrobiales bacterium]
MTVTDTETWLQEKEIVDLTIRYTWALDHRRFDDLAQVFADDGVADYGRLGVLTGPAAIGQACAGALARFDRTQHIVSNHQVTIDGDTAQGRCYVQAQHVWRDRAGDRNYTVAGSYLDRYRRTGAGWRIAHRTLRVTWTDGQAGPPDQGRCDTSFVIAGWIDVDPGRAAELLDAAVPMMAETRREPGNLEYAFSADPATPGRIRVFERWRSDADLRGHFDTPHMAVFQKALARAGVRDRDLARFHVSGVGPVFDVRPS